MVYVTRIERQMDLKTNGFKDEWIKRHGFKDDHGFKDKRPWSHFFDKTNGI